MIALTKYHEEEEKQYSNSTLFNLYNEYINWKKGSINDKTLKSYDYTYNNYLKKFSEKEINDIKFFELQNILINVDNSYSTKKAIKSLIVGYMILLS